MLNKKSLLNKTLFLFVLTFLAVTLSACVIGVEETPGVVVSGGERVEVLLRVDSVGADASLSSVTYQVGGTSRTVDAPGLPFSTQVSAAPGDSIFFSAVASAARGATVTMSYEAIRSGTVVAQGSRTCDQIGCPGFQLSGQISR